MQSSFGQESISTDGLSEILARAVGDAEEPLHTGASDFSPPADIKVTPSEVAIFLDLPGIDEDEVQIDFQDGLLVVSGEREFDHDQEDAEEFVRIDRRYGRFMFTVPLEHDVDFDHARAKYRRGVLKIRIPRLHTGERASRLLHTA